MPLAQDTEYLDAKFFSPFSPVSNPSPWLSDIVTPLRRTLLTELSVGRQRISTRRRAATTSSVSGKGAKCKDEAPVREGGWSGTCCPTAATSRFDASWTAAAADSAHRYGVGSIDHCDAFVRRVPNNARRL